MSRGPITTYVNTNSEVSSIVGMQKGDIAIVKYSSLVPTTALAETSARSTWQTEVYQYNGTTWAAARTPEFTDPTIVPNVTKIRVAHIDETRKYIRYLQDMYTNRYGDKYYNGHDLTNAILQWGPSDTNIARMYLGDYGSGNKWLTVEFSDSSTDRIKFLYKNAARVASDILDIRGDKIYSYVPLEINNTLTVNNSSHFIGAVDIDSTLNVDGNTTLLGATNYVQGDLSVDGTVGLNSTLEVDGVITANSQVSSTVIEGTSPFSILSSTVNTNLNSDLLDGYDAGHQDGQIPINDGTLNVNLNAEFLDGHPAGNLSGEIPINNGVRSVDLNADTLDGYHAVDLVSLIKTVEVDADFATSYAGASFAGKRLKVDIGGTIYYLAGSTDNTGICHSQCHANCHNNCHTFHMCYTSFDSKYKDTPTLEFDVKDEIYE